VENEQCVGGNQGWVHVGWIFLFCLCFRTPNLHLRRCSLRARKHKQNKNICLFSYLYLLNSQFHLSLGFFTALCRPLRCFLFCEARHEVSQVKLYPFPVVADPKRVSHLVYQVQLPIGSTKPSPHCIVHSPLDRKTSCDNHYSSSQFCIKREDHL